MEPFYFYKNICLAQTNTIDIFFKKVILENSFSRIIEIGTNRGGLTLWLSDNRPEKCDIYSFDITDEYLMIDPQKENINFIQKNVFSEASQEIHDLISSEGQTLLLCDGGNKNHEFNVFSESLKSGDIIMCHDFMDDSETYNRIQSEINWPSIAESYMFAIKGAVDKLNLQPYLFNEAKNNLWGSFKKQ
jgi:23S rRNA U2552 (ribose-2'-O)-methylase RlmE/FtsJ